MKVYEVLSCSLPSWYKQFEFSTIKSIILPVPAEVLSYLLEDGTLVLPEDPNSNKTNGSYEEEEEEDEEWENDDAINEAKVPDIKSFSEEITIAVKKLGGDIFPKLNWSSPKDASWIAYNKSLKCSNPSDVYLLLKSSDFVAHDLTCPFKDCVDVLVANEEVVYSLVLRQWSEINPSDEFRCFVKDGELIGICQRDVSQYYETIKKEKEDIEDDIIAFWEENICEKFPLSSYVFDVHRPAAKRVILIDFGPFGPTTDGLMFSWQELSAAGVPNEVLKRTFSEDTPGNSSQESDIHYENKDLPEFRYIWNDNGIQPSPYMHYGLPVDILDLSTGEDPLKLADFLQMRIQREDDDDSADEGSSLSL